MDVLGGTGSSSGCSSTSGARRQRRNGAPWCKCGRPCAVYTSKTDRNPNRQFYGCPNYKEGNPFCKFFTWVDHVTTDLMEVEEGRMNHIELTVAEMEFKWNYVDMKLTEQQKKLHDQEMKLNEMSLRIVEENCRVDREINKLGRSGRVLVASISLMFILGLYLFLKWG